MLIWDVRRLVTLSRDLPPREVALASIRELEEPYWFSIEGAEPTCRAVIEHARLIDEADPWFPIILSADGRVMDGMHRVAKAVLAGRTTVLAVQFASDPEPDFVDKRASELPD